MAMVFNPFTGTFDFTGSSASASNSFTIMQPDTGTAPTATSATDTLTFTSSDLGIAGNSSTKTLTFSLPNATVIAKVLTGFSAGAGTVAATDTILQGFNKVVGNIALKAPLANPAFTGSIKFGNYCLHPSETAGGNSSTSQTIDWSSQSAEVFTLTGNCTFSFSNGVTGGSYILRLLGGSGGFTITLNNTTWINSAGTGPSAPPSSKLVLINLYCIDGTNYWATYIANY